MFLAGNLLQWHTHKLLAGLGAAGKGAREATTRGSAAKAKPTYKIPQGERLGQAEPGECCMQLSHSSPQLDGSPDPISLPVTTAPSCAPVLAPSAAGNAFALVSCPHYLGEIVIYTGLLLAEGARRPLMWLMLGWVVSGRGRGCCAASQSAA